MILGPLTETLHEKTGPYNLLFLFSIGIDKTRAMGLLRGLME
jgi:lysine decarboxylase